MALHETLDRRLKETKSILEKYQAEYKMICDLQANPAECIEAIKQLNDKPSGTDLKGLDTIGRVKTRIVIDAEQSLTEKAFRVNKVTKKTMGWSETDQRERRDALKKKGRKKEHIY